MFGSADGIVCGGGSDEVGRDEFGALMDKLVEGVLAVCTGRSPYDRLQTIG
jgi:hypothetical protein